MAESCCRRRPAVGAVHLEICALLRFSAAGLRTVAGQLDPDGWAMAARLTGSPRFLPGVNQGAALAVDNRNCAARTEQRKSSLDKWLRREDRRPNQSSGRAGAAAEVNAASPWPLIGRKSNSTRALRRKSSGQWPVWPLT